MRRHHLIEEAKAELDVTYEEVKRAETKIMRLEQDFNAQIKSLKTVNGADGRAEVVTITAEKEASQDAFDIENLYRLQGVAVERFSMVSAAFTIVSSIDDEGVCVDLMRNILFRNDRVGLRKRDVDAALRAFGRGLRAYTRQESSLENDRKVRDAWADIETLLREFGSQI